MVTTNRNKIKKETASVKHYKQNKKGKIYITKRINLDSKSNFADNEKVIVIAESDFNNYYESKVKLDDFMTDPADAIASPGIDSNYNDLSIKYEDAIENLQDLQCKYNKLLNKYEDALKQITMIEREKAEIKDNHFEELQDLQTKYNLLNTKYAENLSELEKASAINGANYDAYITALENISIKSEIALKSAIADAVKQTTIYNNNEFAKLSFIKRIKKEELTAPAIEDDTEIFAPAFEKIKAEINSYKFLQIE